MYRTSTRKAEPAISSGPQTSESETLIVPLCCYTTEMTVPQAIKTILCIDFTLLVIEFFLIFIALFYIQVLGVDKILVWCVGGASVCQLIFVVISLMAGGEAENLRSRTSVYRHVRFLVILFKILILCLLICKLSIFLFSSHTNMQPLSSYSMLMNWLGLLLLLSIFGFYTFALFLNSVLASALIGKPYGTGPSTNTAVSRNQAQNNNVYQPL
jgi:hypothetical protein